MPKLLIPIIFVLTLMAGCASTMQQMTRFALDAERQRADLVRKEIVLADGMRYVYLEGGQGEPLILLHGFGGNKDNFVRVARYLTPHYRVIVPDQLGFGEAQRPAQADYGPAAQAKRLHMLTRALGIESFHLGGNSMGGQISLAYATLYPQDVSSLWLLNPAGIWSAPKSEVANVVLETGRNPLVPRNEEEFAELFDLVMSDPPFAPRPVLNIMAQDRIRHADLEQRIFLQIANGSVEEQVRGLKTPALIVWGEHDRVIHPATADILHRMMPRSRVVVMRGVGHMPMLERPQQSADDYLKFRSTLAGTK